MNNVHKRIGTKKQSGEPCGWLSALKLWMVFVYLKGMYQFSGLVRSFRGLFAFSLSANQVLP